jgi:cell division protein FtsB
VSLREKILAGLAVALGLGALAFAFVGEQGLREVRRLRSEKQEILAEIDRLREKRQVLERRVSDLQGNRDAIGEKARRDLGMVRRGETVFLLPERHGKKP